MKSPWVVTLACSSLALAFATTLLYLVGAMSFSVRHFRSTASDFWLYFPAFVVTLILLISLALANLPTKLPPWLPWILPAIGALAGIFAGMLSIVFLTYQESGGSALRLQFQQYSWRYLATIAIGATYPLNAWLYGAIALPMAFFARELHRRRLQ